MTCIPYRVRGSLKFLPGSLSTTIASTAGVLWDSIGTMVAFKLTPVSHGFNRESKFKLGWLAICLYEQSLRIQANRAATMSCDTKSLVVREDAILEADSWADSLFVCRYHDEAIECILEAHSCADSWSAIRNHDEAIECRIRRRLCMVCVKKVRIWTW